MRLDDRTLAELVIAHPGAARALERHGLDYCCHGDRSLGDACRTAGLDPEMVASELSMGELSTGELAADPAPWAHLGVAALVDHVEAVHHQFLWEELPRVGELVAKVVGVHGERHPELEQVATRFEMLRADLEPHLVKEEQVLVPMIRQLANATTRPTFHCGRISNPISVMMREHDRAGELLAELRALTNGYRVPDDGCASYRACYEGLAGIEADTHLHVHKENNVLFPAVVELEQQLHDVQPEPST
jgi:regulator of cell morphogenesis and NO signaling